MLKRFNSKDGAIELLAHLSIAAFVSSLVITFNMPNYPGLAWQETLSLAIVIMLGLAALVINLKHNNLLATKVKQKVYGLSHAKK